MIPSHGCHVQRVCRRDVLQGRGPGQCVPVGKGSRLQPPQTRNDSRSPTLRRAPGLAFVNLWDRQAFICMKIDFRKPLKCNKKVFNALECTKLISTSLLDLPFLFFSFSSPPLAWHCCTNSPYGKQRGLETPSSRRPLLLLAFAAAVFSVLSWGSFLLP